MPTDPVAQQPCSHCGGCLRACPESLDPEALFFALVGEDWAKTRSLALDACTECNRCVEVCPSHIPLLDWLRWGNAELALQRRADVARARFLARGARLARERDDLARKRAHAREPAARTISKQEVMDAIARGRGKRSQ